MSRIACVVLPQIRLDHHRVLDHLTRVAQRQLPAFVHHQQPLGKREYGGHDVLDEEHRQPVSVQVTQQVDHRGPLSGHESGQHLVEEDHPWLECQCPRQLQPLQAGGRKAAGERVDVALELDPLDHTQRVPSGVPPGTASGMARPLRRCRARTCSRRDASAGRCGPALRPPILSAGQPVTSTPPNTTLPCVGGTCPASRENKVVFPAPLGPTMPRNSWSSTSRSMSSTARQARVGLGETLHLQHAHLRHRSRIVP